jgi:hypothetical protein
MKKKLQELFHRCGDQERRIVVGDDSLENSGLGFKLPSTGFNKIFGPSKFSNLRLFSQIYSNYSIGLSQSNHEIY